MLPPPPGADSPRVRSPSDCACPLICIKMSGHSCNRLEKNKPNTACESILRVGARRCGPMTEITQFEVVPFDYVGNNIVAGEPIDAPRLPPRSSARRDSGRPSATPARSRSVAPAILRSANSTPRQILRRFGQVPSKYDGRPREVINSSGSAAIFALIVVAGCTLRHHGPRLYVGVFRFEAAVALAPPRPGGCGKG